LGDHQSTAAAWTQRCGLEAGIAVAQNLRVLILDDNALDAELEVGILGEAGYACEWDLVANRKDFLARLQEKEFDLILSDYSLPAFDGVTALKLLKERDLNVPFVLISGTVGEEVAIECLKAGATDYVLKTRLSRLALVVQRALQEKEEQRRRQRAEEALRSSEQQLRQSQKMEAVGRLAGGIAHDFNNLLMVMMGYTELLLEQLKPGNQLREHAQQVWNAGQRATAVTQQLLAFSRRQAVVPKVLDLNGVLANLGKMLPRLIGEDVQLVIVPGKNLGMVHADSGQLEQVIMNLVVNARDAMPDGGELRIETANARFAADDPDRPASVPCGDYVSLSVKDSGVGINPEMMSRIFEPFFTTKEVGKGTGLGLAMVYGIVQQSSGHIAVESKPGAGTDFTVFLPRVTEAKQAAEGRAAARQVRGGTETILLVEDEEGVRSLVLAVLQSKGYNLLEAPNAHEGLRLAEQHKGSIDMVLTDVILPQMTGRELAERLQASRPGIKVLFMSGYTDDKLSVQGGFHTSFPFLQKPFSTEMLALKVRELLDSPVKTAASSGAPAR